MEDFYNHEYEFDGVIYDNFGKVIEAYKAKMSGASEADAKNKMLYVYKRDHGLDPRRARVVFEGTIRPTGRRFPK